LDASGHHFTTDLTFDLGGNLVAARPRNFSI
jgi:hypothetical protein